MAFKYMDFAIKEALNSGEDIPVGAVIVKDGQVVASACNMKEKDNDVTSHAEILALRKASKILNNWRLDNCDMYVTLEPCPMCAWAILQSRIKNLYFGSYDNSYGGFSSVCDLRKIAQNSSTNIYGGIKEDECNKILQTFFQNVRNY